MSKKLEGKIVLVIVKSRLQYGCVIEQFADRVVKILTEDGTISNFLYGSYLVQAKMTWDSSLNKAIRQ